MGKISADVFRRLYLLSVIGAFPRGVYGAVRLQKIDYLIEREYGCRPFNFVKHDYGQFSRALETVKDQLISMGYVYALPLDTNEEGNRYGLTEQAVSKGFDQALRAIDSSLVARIADTVNVLGLKPEEELIRYCYGLPEFQRADSGDLLHGANIPDEFQITNLSDDECEELELALSPSFIGGVRKIIEGLQESEIDWGRVRKVVQQL